MHAPAQIAPCAPPLLPERAEVRRLKVTDAARKLFACKGFHNTGMAEIAAASAVKVGQIYRDFPSKESIVAAIVEADFATFIDDDSLRIAIEEGDRATVMAAIEGLFAPCPCEKLMPEIMAEAARNPRIAEIVGALDERFLATLTAALAVFAPGEATHARRREVAEVIMILVVGLCHRAASDPGQRGHAAPLRLIAAREIEALAAAQGAG
ncbi:TetR/AcrR family transcriptional regulator [Sphingomonas sp.]|jgi:AcrR family transcriptional regulator|uniref:TetR/AcrR family transcriptional regulator n=1 Tax=Sphingomonas sp. TaxID=28214 RepID=UPI002EDA1946